MGRELAIACIPCAQMTPARIQTLHELVDDLDEGTLEIDNHSLNSEDYSNDELVALLHEQVDLIAVLKTIGET